WPWTCPRSTHARPRTAAPCASTRSSGRRCRRSVRPWSLRRRSPPRPPTPDPRRPARAVGTGPLRTLTRSRRARRRPTARCGSSPRPRRSSNPNSSPATGGT
ncbi:MAG: hypothetical protein AVDCRST_MAG66-1574, partial [uncultured Pseudonocardia sp.]